MYGCCWERGTVGEDQVSILIKIVQYGFRFSLAISPFYFATMYSIIHPVI